MASPSLSTLLSKASLDDHDEILAAAEKALATSKSDVSAQQARVVALLKLERYDEALKALQDGGPSLQARAKLEYAYALYKCGQLDAAREIVDKAGTQDRAFKHLSAQIAYRSEDFEAAAAIYEELSGSLTSEEKEIDLRINAGACDAQLLWQGKSHVVRKQKPDREDLELFDSTYNAACAYIARGRLREAEVLLKRASDLCLKADDLSDEQKEEELLSIKIQQLYVLCRLGKSEEADKLAESIQIPSISDPVTKHIAQTNVLKTSKGTSNPYLAHRIFNSTSTLPQRDLPFSFQSAALRRTSAALDLAIGKFSGVSSSALRNIASVPATSEAGASEGVLAASAAAHNRTGKAALKAILPELERRPSDVGLLLTVVQLYVLTDNVSAATALLESFFQRLESSSPAAQDTRFSPGLVATLVTLYARQHRAAHTKAELARAASFWRHKSKPNPSILRAAGSALLDAPTPSDLEAAHEAFAAALATNPTDALAQAGLVASSSTPPPQNLLATLPLLDDLLGDTSAPALLEAGIPSLPTAPTLGSRKRPPPKSAHANDPTAPPRPGKKLRPSRTPADYSTDKKPDPERWLPMRDRSYYKPKKGKKGKGATTQGGPVAEDSSGTNTPSAGVVTSATSGAAASAQQKKKKKGKK